MKNKSRVILTVLVCVLAIALVALCCLAVYLARQEADTSATTQTTQTPTTETQTVPTTTAEPTTMATTVETEPQPIVYTLSFAGDCTFGNRKERYDADTFISIVGEDYAYPFADVAAYFQNDDCTFINLEGPLTDGGSPADKKFVFKGPTTYVNIMTEGSVEFANVANNHAYDYGSSGYRDTLAVLDQAGIFYADSGDTCVFTTPSGLTVGVYAHLYPQSSSGMAQKIASLREQGAEIIIASLHWGQEYYYNPNGTQVSIAHDVIDAGADIVYGHHPHVLQKIEEYNGGIIYYSLGNFSFGGNTNPIDKDSAIIQQQIIREPDGTVHLGEVTAIPVFITGINPGNDFQPVPMEAGTEEYDRVMTKLAGKHDVNVLYVPYRDDLNNTATTAPTEAATQATEAPDAEDTTPVTEAPGATEAPQPTDGTAAG